MPHIKEPTQEDIDKWHGIYCKEVERLFEVSTADAERMRVTL